MSLSFGGAVDGQLFFVRHRATKAHIRGGAAREACAWQRPPCEDSHILFAERWRRKPKI